MLHLDIYTLIAKIDIESYRAMLAVPVFARHTLQYNKCYREHFTVCTVTADYTMYTLNGKPHREDDQPAIISADGMKRWCRYGLLHRDGDSLRPGQSPKPAIIFADGARQWYRNGKLHRDGDQPALVTSNNCLHWYRDGVVHREGDQPARIWADGSMFWLYEGKRHREGGKPAVIYYNGVREWYTHGVCTESETQSMPGRYCSEDDYD